jgi:hypothetical protein
LIAAQGAERRHGGISSFKTLQIWERDKMLARAVESAKAIK